MATVRNYIDALLQAASPRINNIVMPTNVLVDTPNVATGLQTEIDSQKNYVWSQATAPAGAVDYDIWKDTSVTPPTLKIKLSGTWTEMSTVNTGIFATLSGQVTSSNYNTYLGSNSVTGDAVAVTGSITSGPDIAQFNYNSGGDPIILVMSSLLESKINATNGYSQLALKLEVGGTTHINRAFAQVQNSTSADKIIACGARSFYIASPGSGSLLYKLTATLTTTGDGTGGGVGVSSLQLFHLKR